MEIKIENFKKNDLKYTSKYLTSTDKSFIILNDRTSKITKNIENIFKNIENYNYEVLIVDIKEQAKLILNFIKNNNLKFDTIISVGTGGKQLFNQINDDKIFDNKEKIYLNFHRCWEKEKSDTFSTNIDEFDIKNKKVLVFEDVIATGKTVWTLNKYLSKNNSKVIYLFCALIQSTSPLVDKSFCNTLSAMMVSSSNPDLDPFWYPPIYSLRHLLYGDDEMPSFYEILNEKYFNNNKDIETLIKKVRKE